MNKSIISVLNPNTRANSDEAFQKGGRWEKNKGRKQTRNFAKYFHKYISIPFKEFSVLDVGCALGDSIPIWHKHYPSAKLYGCDISEIAIKRCKESFGHIANFFLASFEEIEGFWDIIYCSNVLEHFEEYIEIAQKLLFHCRVLYVMTPFAELRDGNLLSLSPEHYHAASFFKNSFNRLVDVGNAKKIESKIFRCPGAWGLYKWQRARRLLPCIIFNRFICMEPLQILYAIYK
ncbi:MAG: class I SAM-dependent methyltransferase [Candidatus Helarchaeota archaeon]|nr:class I SAM-dependent methyltransferase [Candidatus Helarchaeota archaeon]